VEGVIKTLDRVAEPDAEWSGANPDPATSRSAYRIYNIGSDTATPLMRYIELIEQAVGKRAQLNLLPLQPGDVPDTCADVADLMRDVSYAPETPVEVGVPNFVQWYREYYHV
jgi:UDP-glucuronate 4-epimerase